MDKPSYWQFVTKGRFYAYGPTGSQIGIHREWWSWTWYLCVNCWLFSLTWELPG